jgi:parallel beta-helix repeat protein
VDIGWEGNGMRHIIMAAALILGAAATAQADTLKVPNDHGTIQDAIDAAQAGDVVVVSKGKYDESVSITKDGIELRGLGNPEIRPGNEHGISITDADDVKVSGFKISGGDRGVHIARCNRVSISKMRIANTDDDGIRARTSSDVNISSCRIDRPGDDGVELGRYDGDNDIADESVDGGSIVKVRVKGARDHGFMIVANDIDVIKCRSDDSDDDGFDVRGSQSTDNRFEKCVVNRTDDEGFSTHGPRTVYVKCTAKGVDEECFDIEGDGSELVKCKGQTARRIFEIANATQVTLTKCKGSKSREEGILVQDASSCRIDGCKITKAGTEGIRLDGDSSDNVVRKTKASRSGTFDLQDQGSDNDIDDSNKFKTVDIDD